MPNIIFKRPLYLVLHPLLNVIKHIFNIPLYFTGITTYIYNLYLVLHSLLNVIKHIVVK